MTTSVTSLTVLDFGRANIDLGTVMAPGDGDGLWAICPFPGYLFELQDGRRILVDNGPNRRHITEPMYEFTGMPLAEHLIPLLTPDDDPIHRLAELGLTVDDIDILILTHSHFDHAGNTGDFADTEIIIHADAHAFGRERHASGLPGGLPDVAHDGTPLNYTLISSDTEVAPGLLLLETPGHAPGHLSVLAHLPETGAVILAIDAIYSQLNRDCGNYRIGFDPAQGHASAERLIDLETRESAWLIYGHDPAQWESLRKAPHRYT